MLEALYAQRTLLAAEMDALGQTIPQPLSAQAGDQPGLRAFFALCARGDVSEAAPPSTWAPALSTPQACTERDLLAGTRCPPSILTRSDPAQEAGRGGAGL